MSVRPLETQYILTQFSPGSNERTYEKNMDRENHFLQNGDSRLTLYTLRRNTTRRWIHVHITQENYISGQFRERMTSKWRYLITTVLLRPLFTLIKEREVDRVHL